jgi:uncharacterized protein Veg
LQKFSQFLSGHFAKKVIKKTTGRKKTQKKRGQICKNIPILLEIIFKLDFIANEHFGLLH